jgi:hypothetical protein
MLHYSRVIAEWCAQTGMFPWSPDEDTHVDIEGMTVGLIYNSEESPEMLHAYIDLGAIRNPARSSCGWTSRSMPTPAAPDCRS